MKIHSIELATSGDSATLCGQVGDGRLWYRFPIDLAPVNRGDAFLAAGLLLAMKSGEPLVIDAPCSPKLLAACRGPLQEIFSAWHSDLQTVQIEAPEAVGTPRAGVGSFFSGGVDSSYTFLRHRDEITHLVSVHGFDVSLDNRSLWEATVSANQKFADSFGKRLVAVETNIRDLSDPLCDWGRYHGAGLAAVGHAIGLPKVFIAASHTYNELFPWGSHPLTDHLWSGEAVHFVHDGAHRRSDKLASIGQSKEALDLLRVCFHQDEGAYNCGKCEKCLRTMTGLRLLGLSSVNLPPLTDAKPISRLWVDGTNDETFFADNLALAESVGDKPVADALRSCLRRYRGTKAIREVDSNVFGGWLHRLKSLFRK